VTAYLCAFDLGMSYRQVAEALGYTGDGAAHTTIQRFIQRHDLPPIPARPWRSGKRLLWADKAPTRPDCPPKPAPAPKVIAAPRQIPVKPRPAKPEVQSLPIAAPPARHAAPQSSLSRMTTPANPPPVTIGGLSERIETFLANRSACTTQTLATCLDAKELTVSQALSLLKHQGRVSHDGEGGVAYRGTLWRVAGR